MFMVNICIFIDIIYKTIAKNTDGRKIDQSNHREYKDRYKSFLIIQKTRRNFRVKKGEKICG